MELLKKVIRKVSFSGSTRSIKEVLEEFVKRSDEEIEDFSGKLDELILAQAVRVLRKKKVCITPEAINEFDGLTELVKSLKEVKENVSKDLSCRTAASPGK
jgi:hypothetical protein